MQPRGRFWGGSPGLQVQYFFFSLPPGGQGALPVQGKSYRYSLIRFFSVG